MNIKLFEELEQNIRDTISKCNKQLSTVADNDIETKEFLNSIIQGNLNCLEDLKLLTPTSYKKNLKEMYKERGKNAKKNNVKTRKHR